jgi:hypothetical protein
VRVIHTVTGVNGACLVNVLFGATTETRVSPSWLGLATIPSIMDMSLPEHDTSHGGSETREDASIVVHGYWRIHKLYSWNTEKALGV